MMQAKRLSFWIALAAAFLFIGLGVATGEKPASDDTQQAPDSENATEQTQAAARIRILLTGFENDVEHDLRATMKQDFLTMIAEGRMDFVTLETTRDYIAGTTRKDADLNALKLAERQGYDFVVWGGTSGIISDVVLTTAPRQIPEGAPGYEKFHGMGFTQHFQYHLDVKFSELHGMVTKALKGLILLRAGRYEQAAESIESTLADDLKNVFGLDVLHYYAGCARMASVIQGGGAGEKDIKRTTVHFAKALDWIRPMSKPTLYGAIKANYAFLYAQMADRAPERREAYMRKARSGLEAAKKIFKEKEYPELYGELDALEKKLLEPAGD